MPGGNDARKQAPPSRRGRRGFRAAAPPGHPRRPRPGHRRTGQLPAIAHGRAGCQLPARVDPAPSRQRRRAPLSFRRSPVNPSSGPRPSQGTIIVMDHQMLQQRFAALTTAHLADACLRASVPVRCAPALLRAVVPGSRLAGRVCPARHAGSVDAFLEAFELAAPGDVLVVDNDGRLDEACVGDLVALEAQAAGIAGMVVWGLHRDTADIRAIGLPVFSLGAIPTGPLRLDARAHDALESAVVGDWTVSREDLVLGDDDGVLFLPSPQAEEIFTLAETIRDTERRQAEQIRAGASLRTQVQFRAYLAKREKTPSLSFREHLRTVGGAVEE